MKWLRYWAVLFFSFLVLFSLLPFSVEAEEVLTDQEYQRLIEIFSELEATQKEQAEKIESLKTSLTISETIIDDLNASLKKANESLRKREREKKIELWLNRGGFLLAGIGLGAITVIVAQ
jgi:septal ring factor EnvC (AmiA/AmiB activator)